MSVTTPGVSSPDAGSDTVDGDAAMAQEPPPAVPEDRFCDLVMKGGITSGLVYPKAIHHLSRHYRFKSIGGTSVGAIAAAITAAAEFQRRQKGSSAGFELLDGLPRALQGEVPGTRTRKLLSLFQPHPGARRLFAALVATLNQGTAWNRVWTGVLGLYRSYWIATLASLGAALAVGFLGAGWVAAVLFFIVASVTSIAYWVFRDLSRPVVRKGFGLCTGMSEAGKTAALTPWLHQQIQRAAGLDEDATPLTFGQLWQAKGFPAWLNLPPDADKRSIDLQIVSTNLSHGRPCIFPLPKAETSLAKQHIGDRFYFKAAELKEYLPHDVLAWLVDCARCDEESWRKDLEPLPREDTKDLLPIPPGHNFPVLLAARMSLSFPFLFSAVPLWAIEHEAPSGQPRLGCCWFSDGGLSSNFPIHLFDGLLPLWPTFGIDLEEGSVRNVLPQEYLEGYGERWNHFASGKKPAGQLGGFVIALVRTMQSWNDNALARMPGVRDRVARVPLAPGLGGLNVNMKEPEIDAIAGGGLSAARALVERFAPRAEDGAQAPGWDEHRWIRLNVLLSMIKARAAGLSNALSADRPHVTALDKVIAVLDERRDPEGRAIAAPGYARPFSPEDVKALNDLLQRLQDAADFLSAQPAEGAADLPSARPANKFHPIPVPELRVRPPL